MMIIIIIKYYQESASSTLFHILPAVKVLESDYFNQEAKPPRDLKHGLV